MDKDTYFQELSNIFQKTIPPTKVFCSNNCVGALGESQFKIFSDNFFDRIKRLYKIFSSNQEVIDAVIICLKNLPQKAGYKWSGSYCELIALDFFSILKDECRLFCFPYNENVYKAPASIAKKTGQKTVDIDLCIQPYLDNVKKLFIDVKSFVPNHHEIIDDIIDEITEKINDRRILIGINNLEGGNFFETRNILSKNKKNIIQKLNEAIEKNEWNLDYVVNDSHFRFTINYRGNLSTMDSFDPYEIAEKNYHKVLTYSNKLFIKENSILCFVVNPWFNRDFNNFHEEGKSLTDYNMYEIFYRSFSRRVFCQLIKENTLMSTQFPEFKNTKLKYSDVAKKITGIMFIEDNSISKMGKDVYRTYLYLNQNATNNVLYQYDFKFFELVDDINIQRIEDFNNDNY